jgi:hypothetical protein
VVDDALLDVERELREYVPRRTNGGGDARADA